MLFSSLTFLYLFLPALFILYYPVKNIKYRNAVLIVFSLLFYAWGEISYLPLLILVVLINYSLSLIISYFGSIEKKTAKKLMLATAVLMNIAVLIFFKYFGLFEEVINLFSTGKIELPKIALPLGISFFTFQALSYTIDVFRGDTKAQKNPFKVLLYISLFPQLIAGPIVRYKDIERQINKRSVTLKKVNDGAFRFALGLGKKVLIANACGSVVTALLDSSIESATVASSWIGILFYALQIYFDFSGYSDMAIGLGKMFGFEFKENFNYPYISSSATEFWRRWHISLGSFFRDYLYIPLGGNRKNWLRNVLIVWFLTGMWHGASLNFILWGLFYGLLLILEKRIFKPLMGKWPKAIKKILSTIYMIFITLFGWTLFYYTDGLFDRIKVMFGVGSSLIGSYEINLLCSNVYLLIAAILFATPLIKKIYGAIVCRMSDNAGYIFGRVVKTIFIIASIAASTILLAGSSYNPFLYFRF